MDNWLTTISTWFVTLAKSVFTYLGDFFGDIVVKCIDWVLGPIGDLLASIPAPSFMQNTQLGALLNGFPPFAQYMIAQCKIPEALVIIGSAVAFNLLRKVFTLGQW